MERDEVLGKQLQNIVLGTVIVFELIGPISIRFSVLKAGELPLAHAISHHSLGMFDQFRTVLNRILLSLGYDPWKNRTPEEMTVNELMRRKVDTLRHNATFDEVIKVFEHARFDTVPVVGSERELIGVIRYEELSHALFMPSLSELGSVPRTSPRRSDEFFRRRTPWPTPGPSSRRAKTTAFRWCQKRNRIIYWESCGGAMF